MNKAKPHAIQPDWWSKSIAGTLLGLLIAYALVGLFAWAGPGGIDAPDKEQFNMWIITPIWLTIFSLTYLFHNGLRAWLWLGSVSVALMALLVLTRWLLGGL